MRARSGSAPTTFGGTATIAARAETCTEPRVDLDAVVAPAQRRAPGVEDDAVAEPLREPQRDQLRAADDAGVEAEVGLEQFSTLPAPATVARR